MTLEILKTKEELRNLIDGYAYLSDKWKISEIMDLFTPDVTYKVHINGALAADISGRENIERDFNLHASQVKAYFTLNGQNTLKIDGHTAKGISYAQIKMIREVEGKDILTDYSVRYDDKYVKQDEKWLIKDRLAYFLIIDSRSIS